MTRNSHEISEQSNARKISSGNESSALPTGIAALNEFLAKRPNSPAAWSNLGVLYRGKGQGELALACYRRALALDPDFPAALSNLGNALKDAQRHLEAVDAHRHALLHQPCDARTWHNLGIAYNEMGQSHDAIRCFDRALTLDRSLQSIRFDRAIAYLRLGDYPRGLLDFEACWLMPRANQKQYSQPQWKGESLNGKRLLISCEQGFGDNILVSRFIPAVKALGATILFQCRPELERLFENISCIDEVLLDEGPLPEYDYYCPSMSLMRLLGTTLQAIPAPLRLSIPDTSIAIARELIPELSDDFRVGIVWSGSVTFEGNARRAARLADFLSLYEAPNVQLYSLQMGEPRAELTSLGKSALIKDLTIPIGDFADTAAIIKRLDLIVMTDSALAHLAGTFDVPVWNLLQEVPCWLYGMTGERTPWYPSMRLLRRIRQGNWGDVFGQVIERLRSQTARVTS